MDWLIALDQQLTLAINGFGGTAFDYFFYLLSSKTFWYPFYGALIAWLGYSYRWRTLLILLAVAVLITLTDRISSGFFKPYFLRLRPCHTPELVSQIRLLFDHCGGSYGFVSSHAANTFGLAAFLGVLVRKEWHWAPAIFFVWAALVSLSRVYLGVHFLGDVVAGALLGILCGWGVRKAYLAWFVHKLPQ